VALALRHTLSSAIIMSASVQAPDPLVLNDPATLGTGLLASGKHTPRDSIDTNGRSHSHGTSQANTLDRTASPSPPSQVSTDSMSNGKPTSPSNIEHSNAMLNGNAQAPQTVSSKDPKAAAQAASDMRNIVRRKLTGYVGFANLPNQWHRKSVRKGFNFNVMVVGEYNLHLIK
jgi:septin 7